MYNIVSLKKYNSNRNEKTQLFMNNPAYIGLSILEISKIVMYTFCYDYVKSKYNKKAKLCYRDADGFIFHVKTEDIYEDIAKDVERGFDTWNYELDKLLSKEKKTKMSSV